MADRVKAPGWYHWTLGLLMGGMAAVQEAPVPWIFAYYPVFGVGLVVLVRAYKKHTGMWVPGYRAGRTRWVAVGGGLIAGAVLMGGVLLKRGLGLDGACLAAGIIVAAWTTALGYVWQKAYRRDLGVA
jgi:hypothetical protein